MSGVGGLADILLVTQHVVCGYAQVGGWVGVQHLGGMALSTLLITLIPALSTLLITLIPPPLPCRCSTWAAWPSVPCCSPSSSPWALCTTHRYGVGVQVQGLGVVHTNWVQGLGALHR